MKPFFHSDFPFQNIDKDLQIRSGVETVSLISDFTCGLSNGA